MEFVNPKNNRAEAKTYDVTFRMTREDLRKLRDGLGTEFAWIGTAAGAKFWTSVNSMFDAAVDAVEKGEL